MVPGTVPDAAGDSRESKVKYKVSLNTQLSETLV